MQEKFMRCLRRQVAVNKLLKRYHARRMFRVKSRVFNGFQLNIEIQAMIERKAQIMKR